MERGRRETGSGREKVYDAPRSPPVYVIALIRDRERGRKEIEKMEKRAIVEGKDVIQYPKKH